MVKRITEEECEALFEKYHTPEHVIGHCKAVSHTAVTIGRKLNEQGFALDIDLIKGAGLVHDVARVSDKPVSYTHLDVYKRQAQFKAEGKKLIVSGCLSQRYADELFEEMPEVDAFIGVNEYEQLPQLLDDLKERQIIRNGCDLDILESSVRKLDENPYTATIKIAEGCNNICAYCIIPKIRGKYRSKREEDIIREAEMLAKAGCKELILIAQDVTYYGKDLYGEYSCV